MTNTTKITTVSALALSVLGAGLMASPVSAQMTENNSERPSFEQRGERGQGHRHSRRNFAKDVTKTVENLSNGVKVTITGSTAEAIEAIQSHEEKVGRENDEITKTRTEISNGVEMTITTENADLVERIQNRAEKRGKGKRGHGKCGHGKRGGERGDRGSRSQN